MFSQSFEKNGVLATQSHQQRRASPIDRLPNEILEYIFSFFVDEDTLSQYGHQLYFSWVCQLWRRIIINHASLWTTIDFRGNTELVATIVKRSGDAGLQVELWDKVFYYPEKLELVQATLIPQAHRIETIQVIMSSSNLESIAEDVLHHPFPSLRHLAFCGDLHDEIPLINSKIPFTLDISKLEIFEIYDSSQVPWDCLRFIMSKVRKLDIRFEWKETCLDFFTDIQLFTQLEVLSMRFESTCDLPQLPTMTLPNVKSLIIEGSVFSSLADCLRISHLQRMAVYDEIGHKFIYHPNFDYNSIRFLSVITHHWAACTTFHIMGSTAKDMAPSDNLWREELLISDSSPVKRFHLKAHFNQESIGYRSSLRVLNDLLPRMPNISELSLPYMLPNHLLPHTTGSRLPSDLITHHTSLASLRLIRSSSAAQVFGR